MGYKDRVGHFHSKVVGVTKKNDDGTKRQAILKECVTGEELRLDHQQDNPHDPNAIAVFSGSDQLGFLDSEVAESVLGRSEKGYLFACFVSDITGGTEERPRLGCNLLFVWSRPGVPAKEVQTYITKNGLRGAGSGGLGMVAAGVGIFLLCL